MSKKKPVSDSDSTRIINPATDTLKIDLELAKATDPVLIIIRGTPQGKKYSLKGDEYVLGRDKSADIHIEDQNVSRQHARLFKTKTGIQIEDCGSRNGTFVNDDNISNGKRLLAKEDMIRVGSTVLKFLPAGELETLYHTNLTNAASLDKLTNLYNRNYIGDVLEAEFKRAKALHSDFSVILFDIDNFKSINDTFGHPGGDYVLSTIGQKMKASGLRERDMVGRYGGEEFIIILPNSTLEQATEAAERVRKLIETHDFLYEGKKIQVTVSLGVATVKKQHTSATELYKSADEALYQAKKTGKNRVSTSE